MFNSDTYQKLLNAKTSLYYQSARYVFSYLQHELETGKVGWKERKRALPWMNGNAQQPLATNYTAKTYKM